MSENELIVKSDGLLSFSIRNDNNRPWWWDLDLGGEPLYRISNLCGTCTTLFSLTKSAKLPLTPNQLSQVLEKGVQEISREIVNTVAALLPKGRYSIKLTTVTPSIMLRENGNELFNSNWDVDYYWQNSIKITEKSREYDVIFPIVARSEISPDRTLYYENRLKNGEKPVALCMTIEDIRSPGGRYEESVTARILLDGHHKVMATSRLSVPISILSFSYLSMD